MSLLKYIHKNIDKALANDPDPLNKVRAQFLVTALAASILVILLALPGFYISSFYFLLYRSIAMVIVLAILIWALLKTPKWKLVAHLVCLVVALLICSNAFVYIEGVKILTLQFMLLLIMLSYYLLGNKYGNFYSAISFVFMVFYFSVFGNEPLMSAEAAKDYTFLMVLIFNFLLIIYLQYHFFNAFNRTIKQLNEKQQEESLINEKLKEAIFTSEQLSKAKSNFLSTISHELRTPLNAVIGMSNMLILDDPRENQKENLNVLKFSANNLLNLINDVLDINKIESGKIEIEKTPFKIYDLAHNIYLAFKDKAERRAIDFKLVMSKNLQETWLIGDQTRLTQILSNLLENALKFTKDGSVNFSINIKEKQDDKIKLRFCVSDTGIGIPPEKQELVFESFAQASTSTTRNYGGTGLGLAIVKNLVELHDSKIIIKSEVGVGTSFTFEILYPIFNFDPDTAINDTNHKTIADMDISNLKILVAEDNQMNILLMRKLLAKWNITPDFALNGSEAVEAHKAKDYDVILMDIHMPIMDGYEASIIIRNYSDNQKSAIPIIALTASVAMDIASKLTDIGINDFISKPFSPQELRVKLESIALQKE